MSASNAKLREVTETLQTVELPFMRVWQLGNTPRGGELAQYMRYFDGAQHDHHRLTWGQMVRDPGVGYMQERLKPQGFQVVMGGRTPRKPDAPLPLCTQVVNRFTELVIGTPPVLKVASDLRTERFLQACMDESDAWASLATARNYKGAAKSAAIVLSIEDGQPYTEPIKTQNLWVVSWESRKGWIPKEVIEQVLVSETEPDPKTGKLVEVRRWQTRYWNDQVVVHYERVPEDYDVEESGPISIEGEPVFHGAGRCPVVWMQNTRETASPDGKPDMENDLVLAMCDRLDRLQSNVVQAAGANCAPTVVHKDKKGFGRRGLVVEKGYGAVISLSEVGDAHYLETTGEAVKMGWDSVANFKGAILQTVRCVIVDPDTAGAYKSGNALELLWRSMEGKCNKLRVPLGGEIQQMSEIFINFGVSLGVGNYEKPDDKAGLRLPPHVHRHPKPEGEIDPALMGRPNAEDIEVHTHEVGEGRHVQVQWAPYHRPTAEQIDMLTRGLSTATGAKPFLSQESATSALTSYVGQGDPQEEFARLKAEEAARMEKMAGQMGFGGDNGGKDDDDGGPSNPPVPPKPPPGGQAKPEPSEGNKSGAT